MHNTFIMVEYHSGVVRCVARTITVSRFAVLGIATKRGHGVMNTVLNLGGRLGQTPRCLQLLEARVHVREHQVQISNQ